MKKGIRIVLVLLFALSLAACGRQADPAKRLFPPAIPNAFESDMTVSFGDFQIAAHLKREEENNLALTFQEPAVLKKLTLQYDGTTYALSYEGLSLRVDPNNFPETGFGALVGETLRTSLDLDALRIKHLENGDWEYTGSIPAGDFTLIQSAETGFLSSLSIPDRKLDIVFSNFVSLEK